MMTKSMIPRRINPIPRIPGFVDGYVLDYHFTCSPGLGSDPYVPENPQRTQLGEYIYNVKYKNIDNALRIKFINDIINIMEGFIISNMRGWLTEIQCIVSAPASVKREKQPVSLISEGLASRLNLPFHDILFKSKTSPPMKNIEDFEERKALLKDVIKVKNSLSAKNILIIDDIFDSGATLRRSIEVLLEQNIARKVFALVLTRTASTKNR